MRKYTRKIIAILFASVTINAHSSTLTDDFLAGKEITIGDNMDWNIVVKDTQAPVVIHTLISGNTIVFIEPKKLVYASHVVKKYLPKHIDITQSVVNYAFLQAIAEFITDDRKEILHHWIKQEASPTLTTMLIPPSVSYQSLPQTATVDELKKWDLRVLLPRPRETFKSKKK